MARVRRGADPAPTSGPSNPTLHALLTAEKFHLGAGTQRIAENFARFGGVADPGAAAWIGSARPPSPDSPSVALADAAATLGPFSFGFLNNVRGIAPLDAPVPSLPRKGGLALVVPRRDELPDIVPLALARDLGVSFIVSVGDGDPAEVIGFLNQDAATRSLAIVLGTGASGSSLRSVLGAKPSILLGGDSLCHAVARKVGARVTDGLDEWLAHASLIDADLEPGKRVTIIVMGGGRAFVESAAARAMLSATIVEADDRASIVPPPDTDGIVLVGASAPVTMPPDLKLPMLSCDLRQAGQLDALLGALARATYQEEPEPPRARIDRELVARVREDAETTLSDHDSKRLLKAYGVRVSRQAPTNTPTGAMNHARTIGLPVVVVGSKSERRADSLPEARRIASLLLDETRDATVPGPLAAPVSVMVRESFPDSPRARVRVATERGLGPVMRVGEEVAILPLESADALRLAHATGARRAQIERGVADILHRIATCAVTEETTFELELFVGQEPAVVSASGAFRRAPAPSAPGDRAR